MLPLLPFKMLPRPPPAHIAKLTKGNGAYWTNQVRNHIILNGFDVVLAPVRKLPASWPDLKPCTSNSEGGIASAAADSTPPSPLLHQAGPRLPYDVEDFLHPLLLMSVELRPPRVPGRPCRLPPRWRMLMMSRLCRLPHPWMRLMPSLTLQTLTL